MSSKSTGGIDARFSYRRVDSAGYAGRLYEHLAQHLGAGAVFMDIDDIPPGADFVVEIENNLV